MDDLDDSEVENAVEKPENPTEDALSVTTDLETKTYGTFNGGLARRLVARIKTPVAQFNVETTKACIVSDDAIRDNLLSVEDYIDIFDCYENHGIVIVTTPTNVGFNTKFQVEMALAAYKKRVVNTGLLVNGQVPGPEDYESPFSRVPNLYDEATREGVVYAAIAFAGDEILYCEDIEGSRLIRKRIMEEGKESDFEEETVDVNLTEYDYGLQADIMVEWMEEQISMKTKSSIDDIDNGRTYSFIYGCHIPYPKKGEQINKNHPDFIQEVIKVNAIHRFGSDAGEYDEYYLIDQTMTFFNSSHTMVPRPSGTDHTNYWWKDQWEEMEQRYIGSRLTGTKLVQFPVERKWLYVEYFNKWVAGLKLSFGGVDAKIVKYSPDTMAGSTQKTHTTTDGSAFSIGGSIGFSGKNLSGMLNLSHQTSHSVSVGYSRAIQDIGIRYTAKNSTEAQWEYMAGEPQVVIEKNGRNWLMGEMLYSTMTQTNSVLFGVNLSQKDTTHAKLHTRNIFQYGAMVSKAREIANTKIIAEDTYDKSIDFELPYRSLQTWNFSFVLPDDLNKLGPVERGQIINFIWDRMKEEMSKKYNGGGPVQYQVLDASDSSSVNAGILLQLCAEQLTDIAKLYGYVGKYTVSLELRETSDNPKPDKKILTQDVLVN